MDSLQAIDKIRAAGTKVYVNSPSEKELFRKQTQDAVKEYIASQAGADVVQKVLGAVEEAKKKVYSY
jgi:hypothetical protein